jgi:hypothetical protein
LNLTVEYSQELTTIMHAALADQTATVVFEGEEPTTEDAEWSRIPDTEWRMPDARDQDGLEGIWRIDPQDLQCKRKANGELVKLGSGTL